MSENPDKSETIDEAPPRNASGAMIPFALSGMVLMAAAVAAVWMWRHEVPAPVRRSTVSLPPEMAPKLEDFELTERSGRTFHPRDMRGQVWVVSFFFSTCIGPCQRLNSNIAAMQQDPDLADVRWVSITVDPDNDTIEVLQRYADRFHADPDRWLFCRNTMEYTEQLGHDVFKLPVGYKGHKEHGVVIDREGRIRDYLDINSRRARATLRERLIECLVEAPPETAASDSPAASAG